MLSRQHSSHLKRFLVQEYNVPPKPELKHQLLQRAGRSPLSYGLGGEPEIPNSEFLSRELTEVVGSCRASLSCIPSPHALFHRLYSLWSVWHAEISHVHILMSHDLSSLGSAAWGYSCVGKEFDRYVTMKELPAAWSDSEAQAVTGKHDSQIELDGAQPKD
jgi:hypothetical protein